VPSFIISNIEVKLTSGVVAAVLAFTVSAGFTEYGERVEKASVTTGAGAGFSGKMADATGSRLDFVIGAIEPLEVSLPGIVPVPYESPELVTAPPTTCSALFIFCPAAFVVVAPTEPAAGADLEDVIPAFAIDAAIRADIAIYIYNYNILL
jgi:hypothetical protein